MRLAESLDAVPADAPVEDFLVDVGEKNAGGELGEIGVALDESAGVENDRVFKDVLGDLAGERPAEFALDLGGVEIEIEADRCELDPLFEFRAVPKDVLAIALGDHDESVLQIIGRRFSLGFRVFSAVAGALGAVKNVALGHLVIPLSHEFLLNQILHILDMNEGRFAGADALSDASRNGCGGGGIFLHIEKRTTAGVLDFGFHPRNNRAVATD